MHDRRGIGRGGFSPAAGKLAHTGSGRQGQRKVKQDGQGLVGMQGEKGQAGQQRNEGLIGNIVIADLMRQRLQPAGLQNFTIPGDETVLHVSADNGPHLKTDPESQHRGHGHEDPQPVADDEIPETLFPSAHRSRDPPKILIPLPCDLVSVKRRVPVSLFSLPDRRFRILPRTGKLHEHMVFHVPHWGHEGLPVFWSVFFGNLLRQHAAGVGENLQKHLLLLRVGGHARAEQEHTLQIHFSCQRHAEDIPGGDAEAAQPPPDGAAQNPQDDILRQIDQRNGARDARRSE